MTSEDTMTSVPDSHDISFPDAYDIVWDHPSSSSRDSMPCGGGGVGLNVWCEGDAVLIYVDRSGSFDENNQMLKLGRLRITPPISPSEPIAFRQQLHLATGHVEVTLTADDVTVDITVWVEVHRPVVHVRMQTSDAASWTVAYESWRVHPRLLDTGDRMACLSFQGSTAEDLDVTTHADSFTAGADHLTWWHRNSADDLLYDKVLLVQHLTPYAEQIPNPQRDLTFGGRLQGSNLIFAGRTAGTYGATPYEGWAFTTAQPGTDQSIELALHAGVHTDLDAWHLGIGSLSTESERIAAWSRNVAWWQEVWLQSRLVINPTCNHTDRGWRVGRNYQLFRYTQACNAYGAYPTKFNGSLFTYDAEITGQNPTTQRTPDFRAWGGGSATAQNQRLVHFPMLRAGDFDLMVPQLDFYVRALPGAEVRTRAAWGHEGASFTEQMESFGLPCLSVYDFHWGDYGLAPRPGEEIGELHNEWCRDQYDTVLEFALMILDWHAYGGGDLRPYLPMISSVLRFFDEHYRQLEQQRTGSPLGPDDKLVLFPGSACETYKDARDPAPTVTGLRVVTDRLLSLPTDITAGADRALWERLAAAVPALPRRIMDGTEVLAPAASWSKIQNVELPQMYPVYPWGLYGVGRAELDLARETFRLGADRPDQHGVVGWKQDPIFAARLGLTDQAVAMVSEKLDDAPRRFPTFWGPGFDWTPDFNHGGSGSIALQEMLMQTPGDAIHLFAAWPLDWDVTFRLHGPQQTVVEAALVAGQLTELRVAPARRLDDVVLPSSVSAPPGAPSRPRQQAVTEEAG